ncbi:MULTISPECIES: hypothetical protein [unclassified Streptomyces]|uniref:hypothetical protein n=1 Tax=unclassified Streptomyces TaxID=2593676 RepID=UPI00093A077F|nr:hypothetical protein [Streptomyces sp. CB02058]OKI96256.1 hypothetical protein AMK10_11560 [Streptomyces sp. CB02058]
MSLADLTLAHWRGLDPAASRRYADEAARRAGGRLLSLDAAPGGGAPHRAVIERGGERYALIPGGEVTVGFDVDAWQPLPEQLVSYQEESLAGGFGFEPDPRAHLARVTTPRRTVVLPTVLMAVEPVKLPEIPSLVPALLAERGLRLPHPDEWEHACGAGAATLFRWGDDCPAGASPYGEGAGPHRLPNAFGLRIAFDVYDSAEMTSDPGFVYGGDGGEAVCGGYGTLLEWLPLATANRNPSTAEFLGGPEGEDMFEDFNIRPVLALG